MEFYQKIEYANPTPLMEQQVLESCLEEVNNKLALNIDEQLKYAWTLDGRQINSIMDLHI